MLPALAIIFIGWPAILGSLLLSASGILWRRPVLLVAGSILCLGFAWYLSAWPALIFKVAGYALPLLHLTGALAVRLQQRWAAWLLLTPHLIVALYLAVAVLSTRP